MLTEPHCAMTVDAGAPEPALPLEADTFAARMAALGPFEPAPHLAVAVSGGADSLALALLLQDWVGSRGGRLTALTVDHGLRPESAVEAASVKRMLRAHGIAHQTLPWRREDRTGNLQAAARAARYALLMAWCRAKGVLHLATAHHLDDQAETFLLRLGHGSGPDGLAAMAPVVERKDVRILRPLLSIRRDRLVATLKARGQGWIEDPSNRDPAFTRVRLRALTPALAAEGLTAPQLAHRARRCGQARAAVEMAVAELLARSVSIDPAGFAVVDPNLLVAAPRAVGLRALACVLVTIGGRTYAPRSARLERLLDRMAAGLGRGVTLAGCRIVPHRGSYLVVRENRGVEWRDLDVGHTVLWDGRFEVALGRAGRVQPTSASAAKLTLGALGSEGQATLRALGQHALLRRVPAPARASLPALRAGGRLMMVPPLGFLRAEEGAARNGNDRADESVVICRFLPRIGLTGAGFTVA